MAGYLSKALHRFQHPAPQTPQNQSHDHVVPNYGAKQQFAEIETNELPLNANNKHYIPRVLGTFLYYTGAVHSTMLVTLSLIATERATPTKSTMNKDRKFLDYAATQEEAIVTYCASDMVLAIHSNASYLCEKGSQSIQRPFLHVK
mmetsp:Transcript_24884/g.38319  ORF Transcript_24884/g.38319 Transcript_24884/m.38319 type:complete len:146 (-) Transcript_24884:31-468(-)